RPWVVNQWGVGRGVEGAGRRWRRVASLHGFRPAGRIAKPFGFEAFGPRSARRARMRQPMPEPIIPPAPLVCAQCLRADRTDTARGWRADWAGGHDHLPLELVVLCADCWRREFGDH